MFSFLEELFLKEYFLHSSILGNYCAKHEVFDYLAKIFKISDKKAKILYELAEQQSVQEITTEADACRYKRVGQFRAINNKPNLFDEQTDAIITIKTEAIALAAQMDLCVESRCTKSKLYQMLLDRANCGYVDALRVLGTLQIAGLFVEKNIQADKKSLAKASEWGDVVAMFLLVRLGVVDFTLQNNFYFATQDTPYWELYKIADAKSFIPIEEQAEILLLNKLFTYRAVKQNVYSEPHAHIIYASGISNEDKEKLLFSENKQLLSEALSLPIHRPINVDLECNWDPLKQMTLDRPSEQHQVIASLRNRDLRRLSAYRPLCICINSQYLREQYARALEKCFDNNLVQRINVGGLQEIDFEPTSNNVFVRSCKCDDELGLQKIKNDTNNVFILYLNGEISNSTMKHVKEFLSTEYRRQFRLLRPNITLDFSYTLPICICDSDNAKKLKTLVETIQIAELESEESLKVISVMLETKAKLYFGNNVELTDNAVELLSKFTVEEAEEIIDNAFRSQRALQDSYGNVSFAIKPYIETYDRQHRERTFGFGGYNK